VEVSDELQGPALRLHVVRIIAGKYGLGCWPPPSAQPTPILTEAGGPAFISSYALTQMHAVSRSVFEVM